MNDIEKALIEKCKNGNIEAFEKLIFDYQKKVFNLCYRYLENYHDASELAQEVFIKVYKSIDSFKGESSLSTWIYKIAASACIDELRRRKRRIMPIEDYDHINKKSELTDNHFSPHEQYEKNEVKREIQEAISQLSEEYKTAIILRDIQGFSYDEIASIVGIPLGTVKSRIKRARNAIKEYLSNGGNFFDKVSSN